MLKHQVKCEVSLVCNYAILYSIVSYATIVLIHHVHFYMVLLVMYSNLNLLEISCSLWMFELNMLYFMLSVYLSSSCVTGV